MNFNDIQCKIHPGQVCVMFCKSCDQLVCPQCIAKVHNGHGLVEIKEGYQGCIQRLKDGQNKTNIKMDKLAKHKTEIRKIKISETGKYVDTKGKIQAHNIALKKAVDQYSENLINELDQIWETLLNSIEKEESKVITLEKQKSHRSNLIEEIIQSKDAESLFKMVKQLETLLEEEEEALRLHFSTLPTFVPGKISQIKVGLLKPSSPDITLQILQEYTTDISEVFLISAIKDTLFISNQHVVQKVHPEENGLKVISSIDVHIADMDISTSNDLLIAPYRQSVLKQISGKSNKLTKTKYSVNPLVMTAVHVTKYGKIVVGARNSGEPFPVKGRRAVITIDQEGRHTAQFEYDKNKQPIFAIPYSITSTNSGNIFVIDKFSSDGRGRVVMLENNGDIINTYNGHPDINTEDNPFKPTSSVTTPSDNIIVPDLNLRILHILNNTGHYITHINTGDIGIQRPSSFAFTSTGKIYIGCTKTKGSTDNAKLYHVKLSGC